MTRDELIREFRIITQDRVKPYLFEDAWVAQWLSDAEEEAALRGRLLPEAQDARVCEIEVVAGTAVYPLHPALYELTYIAYRASADTRRVPLLLASTEAIDDFLPDWRERQETPCYAVQDDTTIRLVPTPDAAGTLLLEGYRLPLKSLAESATSKPEIHAAHHRQLIHWALHRAFSLPDAETLDLNRAAEAEQVFTAYFGLRPDSDLRRTTREDVPHTTKVFFP